MYERYVLFSGSNASGELLSDLADCYRAIGEILFLDFSAGPMSGWIQGVRVNRRQYLRGAITNTYRLSRPDGGAIETHADQWKTAFSSAGISKLVFPSWRLINHAKYELAAQMVALMDPGRFSKPTEILNTYRDRFLFDCGFLQGERMDDSGRQAHWQVRDRLAKQINAGLAINSVYEHIQKYQAELVGLAKSMYTEKNTIEAGNAVWRKLASLWGDPYSSGNEGDWPRQIRENRWALAKEVHDHLPRVIEDFRSQPAVGLSGVMALLKEILELLERPADQARYADWFRQQRTALKSIMDESEAIWAFRLSNAGRVSRGRGANLDNHKKMVEKAAETLGEYWRARVNDYISDQAPEALNAIRGSLLELLGKLEAITEKMLALESEYQSCARYYAAPQRSFIVYEVAVPGSLGDLLEPYLGRQTEQRNERLRRLLERCLRQMGLDTLEQIGETLSGKLEEFRDNLAAQAFYALRGQDGRTAAFVENSDDAAPGFIEQYPLFRILKESYNASQRREIYDRLYMRGLPWAQQSRTDDIGAFKPHGDALLGYVAEGNEDVAMEMAAQMAVDANLLFNPRLVRTSDPSEVILYTELTGFPVYYLSELADLRRYYEPLLNDTRTITSLHIDLDYDQLQPLMPYNQSQLASYKHSWLLFVMAQMLGFVRSAGDDARLIYQWRRKVGVFAVQWIDLGAEGRAIESFMHSPDLRGRLQSDIAGERERFLTTREGNLRHLIALADYYFFCIFPVRAAAAAGPEVAMPLGSMQNLVCNELRAEWRNEALRTETDPRRLEEGVGQVLSDLATWSKPAYRDRGQPVPGTLEVPPAERQIEWGLEDQASKAVRSFVAFGLLPQTLDSLGNLVVCYPRLAIDWAWFERKEEIGPPDIGAIIERQRDVAGALEVHPQILSIQEPLGPKEMLLLAFRLVAARRASPDLLLHLDGSRLREAVEGLLADQAGPGSVVDRLRAAAELLARQMPDAVPDPLWQGWMLATQHQALQDLAAAAASALPA